MTSMSLNTTATSHITVKIIKTSFSQKEYGNRKKYFFNKKWNIIIIIIVIEYKNKMLILIN